MMARGRSTRPAEEGFVLIEVLISAVIVLGVSGAVFGLLTATAHSSAEERHRSEAYAVAQEDQARLRSLRVPTLDRLSQTKTVTLNGTPFTVESSGVFVNDKTGTASCGQETSSADYVKITSTVAWPSTGVHAPVTIQSIVTPPNGALDPTHGTLTIFAEGANGAPMPGIGLSGTGAGTFSGSTDAEGCAMFPDQASGNYTLTPSASGLVEKDGNVPGPQTVGVIAGSTSTLTLRYDRPGSIPIKFTTLVGGKLVASTADSAVVFNSEMSSAKTFYPAGGSAGGPRLASITATPLFPFTSPDTAYAGACASNNPNPKGETSPPAAAAMASVIVPAGGTASPGAEIQLPALNLSVWSGPSSSSPGSKLANAHVTVSDETCVVSGKAVKRTFTTTSTGLLANPASPTVPDPGLPWGTYEVCADNGSRHQTVTKVAVQSPTVPTVLNLYTGEGTGAVSQTGKCP
jgi:Tfp pilus assembly protein PilV